jgi:hypothetical protein
MRTSRTGAISEPRHPAKRLAFRAQTMRQLLQNGDAVNGRPWIGAACVAILLSLWLSLVPCSLQAQVGTSDVLGNVTDSSGAVVVGANVTIKNLGTAEKRTAATSDKGEYLFTTLPNGNYTLTVEAKGFETFTIKNFPLSSGDRARYDAALKPGAATETVEVTEVNTLQTDSPEVASTVPDTSVQEMPLNSRNFSSALQTQPGMSMGTNSQSFAGGGSPEDRRPAFVVVANGQNDAWNDQLIDGFDNNERNLGLAGVRPSIDGIEEVKIDSSSYSAEYGRAAGAVINVITKAGTNSFHGSAYEYFRNDIFDARDFFAAAGVIAKPELRLNEFGGSVGGPVTLPGLYHGKDKTFFFADFEQDRLISGLAPYVLTVPTAYEETQFVTTGGLDLTDANPALAIIPAANVSPIMANYFALFPSPNTTSNCPAGVGCFISSPPVVQHDTNVDARIDEHFSPSDILFARFADNPVTTLEPEAIPETPSASSAWSPLTKTTLKGIYPGGNGSGAGSGSFAGPSSTKSYNGQVDYVHIFSSNLILDLKTGFTRVDIASLPFNDGTGAAQQVGFASNINTLGLLPAMGGPGLAWTPLLGSTNSVPLLDINNTFQYAGSVTYTRGAHSIKAGGSAIRRQVNAATDAIAPGFFLFWGAQQGPPGGFYPDSRQNFIAGYPSLELREDAVFNPGFRAWEFAGYVQDDWRVNRSLTVNVGIRYDIFKPFTEAHGYFSNFLPSCLSSGTIGTNCFATGSSAGGGGVVSPTVGVNTDTRDVAPRVGFAWSMNAKTVLRGGFGMSYFPPDLGEASSGTGAPVSVLQNYNPPYSFNYAQPFPFDPHPGAFCTVVTPLGGTAGCISEGPVAPSTVALATFASNPAVTSVSAKPLNIRSAYVEMANLAVQRQLGANNTVSLAWVGEFGRGLLRTINLDQPAPPGAGNPTPPLVYATQLPFINTINYYYNGSISAYNSMQLVYTRQLARGLTAGANWTWSHDLGDGIAGSEYTGPVGLDYGNVPNDLRHRVAVTADYAIPFGNGLTGINGFLAKGWKLNGVGYWQTGNPFTVYFPQSAPSPFGPASGLNVPNLDQDRPNVIASTKVSNPSISEWFNINAFAAQQTGTQGDERIGQLFGPHQRDVDLSLLKEFKIVESLNGEFRAECFNISNTPNYALPDNNYSHAQLNGSGQIIGGTFGQILGSAPGTNARQWQFAMKFLF